MALRLSPRHWSREVIRCERCSALFAAIDSRKNFGERATRLAVGSCRRRRRRKLTLKTPGLDEAQSFVTGSVGFSNLSQPSPKEHRSLEMSFSFCGADVIEKFRGKSLSEKLAVSIKMETKKRVSGGTKLSLQTSLACCENRARKVGQKWLFGHTFNAFLDRLFIHWFSTKCGLTKRHSPRPFFT